MERRRRAAQKQLEQPLVVDTANQLTSATGITIGIATELGVSSNVTPGRIRYVGFDGVRRSFNADINAQSQYLRGSAEGAFRGLRVAGSIAGVAGGAFAANDVYMGLSSGDDDRAFGGAYQLTTLGLALVGAEPVALGMELAALADFLSDSNESVVDQFDLGC